MRGQAGPLRSGDTQGLASWKRCHEEGHVQEGTSRPRQARSLVAFLPRGCGSSATRPFWRHRAEQLSRGVFRSRPTLALRGGPSKDPSHSPSWLPPTMSFLVTCSSSSVGSPPPVTGSESCSQVACAGHLLPFVSGTRSSSGARLPPGGSFSLSCFLLARRRLWALPGVSSPAMTSHSPHPTPASVWSLACTGLAAWQGLPAEAGCLLPTHSDPWTPHRPTSGGLPGPASDPLCSDPWCLPRLSALVEASPVRCLLTSGGRLPWLLTLLSQKNAHCLG